MGQIMSAAFTSFTRKLAAFFRKTAKTLKPLIEDVFDAISTIVISTIDWIKEHPVEAAIIAAIIVVCIIPIALMPHILAAAGFTAAGPAAGTTAAVAAGSPFAIFQSAAMGGAGVAAVRAWNWFRGHNGDGDPDKDEDNDKKD